MKPEPDPIEAALRSAPIPQAPSNLKSQLEAGFRRPRAAEPVVAGGAFWKRWWPVLLPGSAVAALAAVVLVQEMELRQTQPPLVKAETIQPTNSVAGVPAASNTATMSGTEGLVETDPRAELTRLRKRIEELNATLAATRALGDENQQLESEIASLTSQLSDDVQAMLEAQNKASRIRCVNNMKQLGLAVRIYATDNEDQFPPDIKSILGSINSGMPLVCPDDGARKALTIEELNALSPAAVAANCSYEFLSPGPGKWETEPNRVMFRCRVHANVTLCDGSVQQMKEGPDAPRLVSKNGGLYFGE
jgi:hypothetical protein